MNITYKEAQEELQQIIHQLQAGAIDMDELSKKVKRAADLIAHCRKRLRETEEELGGLFGE
ncbi:MAG: exodeoxyribonuclease VII small subunit [Chitinophagales bacterium]|nr:exodeoxyribonuclease VII small subunit [Chitinophagales bacterium]